MTVRIQPDSPRFEIQTSPQKPTPPDLAYCHSSVTSCRIRSLFSWIPALTNQIWLIIKSLLTCCRYPHPDHSEFIPEIDPDILPAKDPFHEILLNDGTLRNAEARKLICELFDILGTGWWISWFRHRATLKAKKKEIVKLDIHPLECLYFLFDDMKITQNVCYFLQQIPSKYKNRVDKYVDKFLQKHQKSIQPEVIPGFCTLLGLEKTLVGSLVHEKKWQKLIEYVHQTRKKHFKL